MMHELCRCMQGILMGFMCAYAKSVQVCCGSTMSPWDSLDPGGENDGYGIEIG